MIPLLKVSALTRRFGGVCAVNEVSFEVRSGDVHAVIGPNGAGKTTLFNVITGLFPPSSGAIHLEGKRIHGLAPEALAAFGLSRTFQSPQLCLQLSAIENVMIGAHLHLDSGLLAGAIRLPGLRRADRECRDESLRCMKFAGVSECADVLTGQLSYGILKRLEIARALAARPKLLLLDEPAAGLNPIETRQIELLVRQVADKGITVLLVEHDMKLIMNISDRILVLNHGQRLAEGPPSEIRADARVIAAYLGEEEAQAMDAQPQEAGA